MNITEIKKLIEKVISENEPLVQEKRKRSFVQDTDIFLNKIKSIKDKYFSTKASISKHSVKKGETLSKIAKRNGISLKDLIKANPQIKNPDLIRVGEKINIPSKSGETDIIDPTKRTEDPKPMEADRNEVVDSIDWQYSSHKKRFINNKDIWPAVVKAADKYDLDRSLLLAMIHTESRFNREAVSPAGARGLIQVMPKTWQELGGGDPFDTERNIELGAKYIRQLIDWVPKRIRSLPNSKNLKYSDEHIALTAYHTGLGRVRRVIKRNGNAGYESLNSVNPNMKYRYADKTQIRQRRYKAADSAVV